MITLRARVFARRSNSAALKANPWVVCVVSVDDGPDPDAAVAKFQRHSSWHEAMQAAYQLLADLDTALMDEVHASRARRRAISGSPAATTAGSQSVRMGEASA